jgi:predicted membrane chloride channel (bestrophin family)
MRNLARAMTALVPAETGEVRPLPMEAFFGLDALSEELEDPFGLAANDLPLDRMCRICEISVFEALGEAAPEPLALVDFYSS